MFLVNIQQEKIQNDNSLVTLKLQNITKDYGGGETIVHALKGIDLSFRKSEFVSILGPSGCGKTTLLNIIGGLDRYTTGDLFIKGKSTEKFKDRNWDAYRNHSIGFVFQSYNLIPHQTVLANVELALTLSGVGKFERRKRAKEVLNQVGLKGQEHKRPNQLSGGQMQRVAIARALVNNPEIILADEPTGALDSQTSVQIMDILKQVSKDRLVIMVTHNGELAEEYSTRIVKMLDGVIEGDSNPITQQEIDNFVVSDTKQDKKGKKHKKPSMNWLTSFGLSIKNLISKKGRTLLTSIAGSVGIIGIALIYAVSQGATNYINLVQEDTLGSYPLTLEAEHTDFGSVMEKFMTSSSGSVNHDKDNVYEQNSLYDMVKALNSIETQENDLASFKIYLEDQMKNEQSDFSKAVSSIQYTYDFDMLVYTKSVDDKVIISDAQKLLLEVMSEEMGDMINISQTLQGSAMGGMAEMYSSAFSVWQEMLPGENGKLVGALLEKQYDLVYGSWPTEYNEVVLVLDDNNELDDMTLFALGLKPESEVREILKAALTGTPLGEKENINSWTYEEICNTKFKTVFNADCYQYDEASGNYVDLRESQTGLKILYNQKGVDLKVSGIIRANKDALSPMLSGSIGYTSKLTEYVINNGKDNSVIKAQLDNPKKDIFTGKLFKDSSGLTDKEKEEIFRSYVSGLNDVNEKAETYEKIMCIPSEEMLNNAVEQAIGNMNREQIEEMLLQGLKDQISISEEQLLQYISSMSDEELNSAIEQAIREQVAKEYAEQVKAQMSSIPNDQKAMALDMAMPTYTTEQCVSYYENVMEFSSNTYEGNLRELGYVDLSSPSSINFYATTFEDKDLIEVAIENYNKSQLDESKRIEYVDYVGLLMSSVTTIIDAITYVLIAFVAVSLVVSAIMIGVITLISVQERTKEIGILRSIGASKRNVSSLFNAETIIIGLVAGLLGVGITYLLCIPINLILHFFTGINNLNAVLPIPFAIGLVLLSVLLTMIAGIIPSRSAAKKDPVVALRLE